VRDKLSHSQSRHRRLMRIFRGVYHPTHLSGTPRKTKGLCVSRDPRANRRLVLQAMVKTSILPTGFRKTNPTRTHSKKHKSQKSQRNVKKEFTKGRCLKAMSAGLNPATSLSRKFMLMDALKSSTNSQHKSSLVKIYARLIGSVEKYIEEEFCVVGTGISVDCRNHRASKEFRQHAGGAARAVGPRPA